MPEALHATRMADSLRELHAVSDRAHALLKDAVERPERDFSSLSDLSDFVYLLGQEGEVVFFNTSHNHLFAAEDRPIDVACQTFLDEAFVPPSRLTDELVQNDCAYLEFEQAVRGSDGVDYRLLVHKRPLNLAGAEDLIILGLVRVLEKLSPEDSKLRIELAGVFHRYSELTDGDQELCRQIALGRTSREIADHRDMTPRGVELRKQKVIEEMGFTKSLDLVRALVRLQDSGLLDLGI